MNQTNKMPVSDYPYEKFHAEQESEVHFCLSAVLSLQIGVLLHDYMLKNVILNGKIYFSTINFMVNLKTPLLRIGLF